MPQPAWFKAVRGSSLDALLTRSRFVLGRSTNCDLQVDDEMVSREHCTLTHSRGQWYITDLDTPNGTAVNGEQIPAGQPVQLESGDAVQIGDAEFVLTLRGKRPIPMELHAGGATARGGRDRNEDDYVIGANLLAVADGVGSRPSGDIAAGIAIDLVGTPSRNLRWTHVVTAIEAALRAHGEDDPTSVDMATTLEAARLIDRNGMTFVSGVHIGDGVALVDDGFELRELTVAHTFGKELAIKNHPEAGRHPDREKLVKGIGLEDGKPDLWEERAIVGHRYILSTDGILRALGRRQLIESLANVRHQPPQMAAETVIALAQQSDLPPEVLDNMTIAIADVCRSGRSGRAYDNQIRSALPAAER
ncbi:FHA domain-containing protein [Nocardia bovistercoris]|uniref:FHA domain-containing protein n=1 Tax=Nocardia bovistercoris TaxID=2785916 RepID=A0A931N1A8_9NOCA|nr:FHA domain-containing protein [Nocardia bovistercoris]MBH0775507.1 FHA domain-containing protein [Nocardia bovistercoris]